MPVIIALLLALALVTPASATPCESGLAPIPGPDGYRERSDGVRCEGVFVSPVSGAAVEPVSFTDTPLRYDLGAGESLSVALAGAARAGPAHVRAIGIPDGLFYRLDADLPPGRAIVWPIGEVLARLRIPPEQVGVLAFRRDASGRDASGRDASGRTVYLPVHAVAASRTVAPGELLLVMRPLVELGDPQWRYLAAGREPTQWAALTTRRNRMEIVLPAAAGSTPGFVQVMWNDPATGTSRTTRFAIGG